MLKIDTSPSVAVLHEPLAVAAHEDSLAAVRVLEAKQLPLEQMVSHQLPLNRVADAIDALNGDYRLDGRTAFKIAVAPNGTMP